MASSVVDLKRFGMVPSRAKLYWGLAALLLFVAMPQVPPALSTVAALAWLSCFVMWLVSKSAAKQGQIELERRVRQWRTTFSTLSDQSPLEDVEQVVRLAKDLAIEPSEIGSDYGTACQALARLRGIRAEDQAKQDLAAFVEWSAGSLREIAGHEKLVSGEPCYFYSPDVEYDRRGPNDETGRFFLTRERVMFLGASMQSTPWSKVIEIRREDLTLAIQRSDRQTPHLFNMPTLSSAMIAEHVARLVASL